MIKKIGEDEKLYSYYISSVDYLNKNKKKLLFYGDINSVYDEKIMKLLEYNLKDIKINEMLMIGNENIFSAKYYDF